MDIIDSKPKGFGQTKCSINSRIKCKHGEEVVLLAH